LKKPLAICAVLGLLGLGAAGTAAAQAVYVGPRYAGSGLSDPVLPPYEIMSIVRSTGLAPLTRPMRRGPYYVLVAVDRAGRQMRVVVDAQLGDIVNMRPAVAAATYGPEAGRPEVGRPSGLPGAAGVPLGPTAAYGAHPNGDALAPMPPRSIPNSAIANAASPNAAVPNPSTSNPHALNAPGAAPPPTRLTVAEPALPPPPPLPRPRPKLALNEAPAAAAAPAGEAPPPPAIKPPVPATTPPSAAPGGADDTSKQIE
jgi:hypothetical protein